MRHSGGCGSRSATLALPWKSDSASVSVAMVTNWRLLYHVDVQKTLTRQDEIDACQHSRLALDQWDKQKAMFPREALVSERRGPRSKKLSGIFPSDHFQKAYREVGEFVERTLKTGCGWRLYRSLHDERQTVN
jgi:hypothetical protein